MTAQVGEIKTAKPSARNNFSGIVKVRQVALLSHLGGLYL